VTDWNTAWQLMDHGVLVDPAGSPRTELDEIELGLRVTDSFTDEAIISLYSTLEDRVWSYMLLMFGLVCRVTTWRGLPLPERWDIRDVAAQMDRMRREK